MWPDGACYMITWQMAAVKIRIDSVLRASLPELGSDLATQISQYLTVTDLDRERAVERGDWGADQMPAAVELWRCEGDELVMPRGFAATLRAGVEGQGGAVEWDDRTVAPPVSLRDIVQMSIPALSDAQELAARELLRHRQGVLQAETGSGKTVIGLEVWRRAGTAGLVVVRSVGLAQQWRDRAQEHLGIETGLIGDGVWEERPLTIAMSQTLSSRLPQLDAEDFWARWGMTIIDEAHHAIAPTLREIISRCVSRYLFGKTATPLERDWRQRILLAMLGPIVNQMAGASVDPLIRVMKTPFQWVPNGREKGLVDSRAIYRHVLAALEADPMRMGLIVTTIMDQPRSCAQLVLSKRLEYLDRMRVRLLQAGYPDDRIFFYRGAESRLAKQQVAAAADEGSCVILATAADEGTDIPRLDRVHLTWPQRRALTVTQQVGRVLREHPDKSRPVVIDYADLKQGVLRAQFYARVNDVYRKRGWNVEFVGA